MKNLSWIELLWYLPLCIISVYFNLNVMLILGIVVVGYTISHYHKYSISKDYRENYKKSILFVHTKNDPTTLTISCVWGILFSLACTIYFFLYNFTAGLCGIGVTLIPILLLVYMNTLRKKQTK